MIVIKKISFITIAIALSHIIPINSFAKIKTPLKISKECPSAKLSTQYIIKSVAAITTGIGINSILDYISTFMHEHGHGLACRTHYSIKIFPTIDTYPLLWSGSMSYYGFDSSFITLAGPLTGIITTYVQYVILTQLKRFFRGSKKNIISISPITFFKKQIKRGYKQGSTIINNHSLFEKETTFALKTLKTLLLLRMGRIIGESIYGFLPYSPSTSITNTITGDGERIWAKLLGPQSPTFKGNLVHITTVTMLIPYVIGMMQAVYEKIQCSSNSHTLKIQTTSL